jgi:dTDP-glucose pyrophosphorylase
VTQRISQLSLDCRASLREVLEAIQRGACGIALVLGEGGKLLGVMTDGDVRRAVLAGAALSDCLEPYMVRAFTSVAPAASRSEVLDLMRARMFSQVPILDEAGKVVGLHLLREVIGAELRPNWAVVMAGGRGERLRPLTDALPKPMVRVAGRPILERIVLHLVGAGIRRVFLSVNYLAHVIEEHFGDGATYGCRIEYLRETEPLGTGGSLSLLPQRPGDPLLVLNGDLVTQFDVASMFAYHCHGGYAATVGLHEYVHEVPYAVVDVAGGRLTGISEKPTARWLTNAGIYVLDPALLERVPRNTVLGIPSLLDDCLERGEAVGAFFIEDDWLDVGRQQELRRARGEESKP